jgi:hypothetical protein
MTRSNRREFLRGLLGALAGAGGTVVLASTTSSQAGAAPAPNPKPEAPADIQERAEEIANAAGATEEESTSCGFLNGGWRNAIGGGFRNGGFGNGLGGGFRNAGFRNW